MNNQQNSLPSDLLKAQNLAYIPSNLTPHSFLQEKESKEYGAFDFKVNDLQVKFRIAKITPTKIGQFVTLWKRIGKGPILPFDIEDPIDLFVISVRKNEYFGQFIFSKSLLLEKGIISKDKKKGKLAIRVYPPWDPAENSQAKKTQAWQLPYFFDMSSSDIIDIKRMQTLFSLA